MLIVTLNIRILVAIDLLSISYAPLYKVDVAIISMLQMKNSRPIVVDWCLILELMLVNTVLLCFPIILSPVTPTTHSFENTTCKDIEETEQKPCSPAPF